MPLPFARQLRLPLEITKSNVLIRAAVFIENNPLANKLFAALVRAINPSTFPEVPAIDSSDLAFIDEDKSRGSIWYKRLNNASKILAGAFVELCEIQEDKWTRIPIMSKIIYQKGIVTAKFNDELRPHLLELQRFFTTYNFFEFNSLKGFYAPRLYENLKSWEKGLAGGTVELKLENKGGLYHALTIPATLQKNYQDMKRILEHCHKEITTKTTFQYSWEPLKLGRKVVGIRFYFNPEAALKMTKARKKAQREGARKNNAMFKLVLTCLREHAIPDGSSQACPDERLTLGHCKLCAKLFRSPSLLPPDSATA